MPKIYSQKTFFPLLFAVSLITTVSAQSGTAETVPEAVILVKPVKTLVINKQNLSSIEGEQTQVTLENISSIEPTVIAKNQLLAVESSDSNEAFALIKPAKKATLSAMSVDKQNLSILENSEEKVTLTTSDPTVIAQNPTPEQEPVQQEPAQQQPVQQEPRVLVSEVNVVGVAAELEDLIKI